MKGVVGFLIKFYCKFTKESSDEKFFNDNWLRFDRIMAVSLQPHFFWPMHLVYITSVPFLCYLTPYFMTYSLNVLSYFLLVSLN